MQDKQTITTLKSTGQQVIPFDYRGSHSDKPSNGYKDVHIPDNRCKNKVGRMERVRQDKLKTVTVPGTIVKGQE